MSWLTIQYLPEQGALDLTADCGSRGQRQLACKKGTTTGEELGWRLSCSEDLKLHLDDSGMRQRRGRPQTHAPPTRHRRDLTGTSMTTTQASSPSQMPLEAHSVPLPSPLPSEPLGTTLSPLPAPSSLSPDTTEVQNSTVDDSSPQMSSSTQTSSSTHPSPIEIKIVPASTFVTSSTNTTSQSPGLRLPTSRPTPTHNLTVSLTVVISPASSEENDTNEAISEHPVDSSSRPSGEFISILGISEEPSQSPSRVESEVPSIPAAKSISIDVLYVEPTSSPEISSRKPETQPPEETTPKSSSVSFTPKSPPILDDSTLSSVPVSVSTISLHPEASPASPEALTQQETHTSPPTPQSNHPVSALPMRAAALETSDAPIATSSNPLPLTSLLTSPPASESTREPTETSPQSEPTSTAPETSSAYLPDTRVDILDGYGSSEPSNPAPKNIRITAVISNDLDDKVEDSTKQDTMKESLKDLTPVDASQNEVLKQGNEEDGYQWIKVSAEKDPPGQGDKQEGTQPADESGKDDVTLTVLSSDGMTTGQGSASSSTDERVGHVEFDGEWTEVGTLDPVSERFLEERDEVDSDISSPPPRPNRSRKLTRPQGRSFYTYFLSRVLG